MIYLGVFIILSPAFDSRFYEASTPITLRAEIANAVGSFFAIINVFSRKFTVLLDGEAVSPLYIVNRMLGEFAAAAVIFSQAVDSLQQGCYQFKDAIEQIFTEYHPEVTAYYSYCVKQCHKDFLWTGPRVEILPSSSSLLAVLSESAFGTLFDLPEHSIYNPETIASSAESPTATPSTIAASTSPTAQSSGVEGKRKRPARRNSSSENAIAKRVRQ